VRGRAIGIINVAGPIGNLQIRGKLQGDITAVQSANLLRLQKV